MPPKQSKKTTKKFDCPFCYRSFGRGTIKNHVERCSKWAKKSSAPIDASDNENSTSSASKLSVSSMSIDSTNSSTVAHNSLMEVEQLPSQEPLLYAFNDDNGLPEPENFFRLADNLDGDEVVEDWWAQYNVVDVEPEPDNDGPVGDKEFDDFLDWIGEEMQEGLPPDYKNLLNADDISQIKFFAIKYRHNMSQLLQQDLRLLLRQELTLLTAYFLDKRMIELAGWRSEQHDCCPSSCIAYTGPYQHLVECPICQLPCCGENGKPSASYYTLPLEARLRSLYEGAGATRVSMNYNSEMFSTFDPTKIRDIHDSKAVRELIGRKVVINGEEQNHTYFDDHRDIPLGLMTDGFQCFKRVHRGNSSVWPIILINYARPPSERMRVENIIPYALIPGPNQPKDFNSFLFPLRESMNHMAKGVRTFDALQKVFFWLRAYLLMAIGDMPASKHLSCMTGSGGRRPCRLCLLKGVYCVHRKSYYYPLQPPRRPPDNEEAPPQPKYHPATLPMRTNMQIDEQIYRIRQAISEAEKKRLSKVFGIAGKSILSSFPGFNRMYGYPHELMHLLFENIIPMLIQLWRGNFRNILHDDAPYVISKEDWEEIGTLTAKSNPTIPSSFSRLVPNINRGLHLFTAEAYAFWFMHMAPSLLYNRFPEPKYYKHAMLLVQITHKCVEFEISHQEIDLLEANIFKWVQWFERNYYQHESNRVQLCTLPLHAFLHVPYDIRSSGNPSVNWSWAIERYCGILGVAAQKGKHSPNQAIANRMLKHALIVDLDARFELDLHLLFRKGRARDYDDDKPDLGRIIDTDLRLAVQTPKLFEPDSTTRRRIASYFPILTGGRISTNMFKRRLPSKMRKWMKLQVLYGGDSMRAFDEDDPSVIMDNRRDSSFVRFVLHRDLNALDPNLDDNPIAEPQYGRLCYIIDFDLPPIDAPAPHPFQNYTTHRLACIRPCLLLERGDARDHLITFNTMQATPIFVHIGVIECAVGRVRSGNGWTLVDRSSEWARTVFNAEAVEAADDST